MPCAATGMFQHGVICRLIAGGQGRGVDLRLLRRARLAGAAALGRVALAVALLRRLHPLGLASTLARSASKSLSCCLGVGGFGGCSCFGISFARSTGLSPSTLGGSGGFGLVTGSGFGGSGGGVSAFFGSGGGSGLGGSGLGSGGVSAFWGGGRRLRGRGRLLLRELAAGVAAAAPASARAASRPAGPGAAEAGGPGPRPGAAAGVPPRRAGPWAAAARVPARSRRGHDLDGDRLVRRQVAAEVRQPDHEGADHGQRGAGARR